MNSDWVGVRVRKGEDYGTVTHDSNLMLRILTIKMDSGDMQTLIMNNVGKDPDPVELSKWEWYWDKTADEKWYRF